MATKNEACEIQDDNLIKLKVITEALEFAGIVRAPAGQQIIELNVENGTSYMVGLYKASHIAVARNFASGGSYFPLHKHGEWELILVYSGEMVLHIGGKKRIIKERGFFYLEPDTEHSAEFPKDCWFLAITMPAAGDWPEGG